MKKRKAQTTVRSRMVAINANGNGKPDNDAFTALDKLHCLEREERRLRRTYHAKILKGERVRRNEDRNIDIMNAIVTDLRKAVSASVVQRTKITR